MILITKTLARRLTNLMLTLRCLVLNYQRGSMKAQLMMISLHKLRNNNISPKRNSKLWMQEMLKELMFLTKMLLNCNQETIDLEIDILDIII